MSIWDFELKYLLKFAGALISDSLSNFCIGISVQNTNGSYWTTNTNDI